jgi:hypothetical protein
MLKNRKDSNEDTRSSDAHSPDCTTAQLENIRIPEGLVFQISIEHETGCHTPFEELRSLFLSVPTQMHSNAIPELLTMQLTMDANRKSINRSRI